MANIPQMRDSFPFRELFQEFVAEYAECTTFWYVPRTRKLNDETLSDIQEMLRVIKEDFSDRPWNPEMQDELLKRLIQDDILDPYKPEGTQQDRTALTRIYKKMWESLGLMWVQHGSGIVITDAGEELIQAAKSGEDAQPIIERQIAKWQYPNPSFGHLADFEGILPHLFLLQVLQQLNYHITYDEFELFVLLSQNQDDTGRIVHYIKQWRELNENERSELMDIVRQIPEATPEEDDPTLFEDEDEEEPRKTRFKRIRDNRSYLRAFYTYPSYLEFNNDGITCVNPDELDTLVEEQLENLKIPSFDTLEDWFAYYGDPTQQPSWFTYLSLAVGRASSQGEAQELTAEGREHLEPEQEQEIKKLEIEKGIEDFYVGRTELIDEDLALYEEEPGDRKGRQFPTPIGPIDLLCRDNEGRYVVVEIKADEARDSAFGQVLRYMGYVHRGIGDGNYNVRGVILAGAFPEKARWSRIGLEPVTSEYKEYITFKEHGLNLQTT